MAGKATTGISVIKDTRHSALNANRKDISRRHVERDQILSRGQDQRQETEKIGEEAGAEKKERKRGADLQLPQATKQEQEKPAAIREPQTLNQMNIDQDQDQGLGKGKMEKWSSAKRNRDQAKCSKDTAVKITQC